MVKKVVSICILLVFTIIVTHNFEWMIGGYPSKKSQIEREVRNYLKEKNYKDTDISKIEVGYSRKFGSYDVLVVFADEQDTSYYYRLTEEVKQSGYYGKTSRHIED